MNRPPIMLGEIEIDGEKLSNELTILAGFSDAPAPAVTRVVFSQQDLNARTWLKRLCREAGLMVREDAIGNLFARWPGTDSEAGAVGTGSHIDAIPSSGRYDGTVGVLGGLEAIRALLRSGFVPRRSIELLLFTSEEPTRFGIGCLGSRLLSGTLNAAIADKLLDQEGQTLHAVRTRAGFEGELHNVALPPRYYAAFLELHIEQGPILEKSNMALGIVTDIAAPAGVRLQIEGESGHAGAVLMRERKDAFVAAAEIVVAIEAAALATGALDTVATAGACRVFPNAVNSIPSQVTLDIDVRDIDGARRDSLLNAIQDAAKQVCARRGVSFTFMVLNADAPAHCDERLVHTLFETARRLALPHQTVISRAYHDSLFMSRIAPSAMLFIPCRAGVSHRPDEYTSLEQISNGVLALAHILRDLAA